MSKHRDRPSDESSTPRVERVIVLHEVSEDQVTWRPYDHETDLSTDALFERITLGPVLH